MADNLGRYESAAEGKPKDPYKKLREKLRKQHSMEPDPADSMLEMRPAGKWITDGRRAKTRSSDLFGTLWREGEVAVLFGDKGSGKSILAVQLAEDIARGSSKNSQFSILNSQLPSQKVLYLDFQRTKQQFSERYSAPSPFPGRPPIPQRFKFQRAQIKWDGHIPAAFKNDLTAYLQHSIFHKIDESKAKIVIIDDISFLAKNISSNTSCLRVMKTLKLWAATYGLSILVIAHQRLNSRLARGVAKTPLLPEEGWRRPCDAGVVGGRGGGSPQSPSRPISLSDIAGSRHIAELADSVFAISRSTFGPDFRYVKHLASPGPIIHHESNVLTYSIEPTGPQASLPANGNILSAPRPISSFPIKDPTELILSTTTNPQSENSQFSILNSQFLALTYLGPSTEPDHLRDYAREARDAERQQARELKALRKPRSLTDIFLSREYQRYLER